MKWVLSGMFLAAALMVGCSLIGPAHSADLPFLDRNLSCSGSGQGPIDCPRDWAGSNLRVQFGTFSPQYYAKRWKKLCKGAGRYTAMAEAYEQGRPDPCGPATEWKR